MMLSSATESVDSPAVRPFQCADCGSRYTRQEHLDRHISAKHRAIKEHVCATCGKGFARRDILRRHELGHALKSEKEQLSGNESPRASTSKKALGQAGASGSRKRTLRCDGKEPCSRCSKGNNTCTYDRAQAHKITSPASPRGEEGGRGIEREGSRDGSEESYATGSSIDLDDDTFFSQPTGTSIPGQFTGRLTPHDAIWNGYNNGALSPRAMSPYGAAFAIGGARPSPLGPGSLHAASYHHLPPLGHQSPYYSHPSSGVRGNFSDSPEFPQPPSFAAAPASQPLSNQSSHAPFASQLALSGYAHMPGSSPQPWPPVQQIPAQPVVQPPGNGDFLDLISSVTQDIEIDWSLLNSYSASLGDQQTYDNKSTFELQNALLQHSHSPMHNHAHLHSAPEAAPGLVFNVDPPSLESSKPSSNHDTPGRDRSLSIQGHAAESLLQLASHTPRESPEPDGARSRGANTPSRTVKREGEEEARPSHTSHLPSDPWPLSYRPTVANEDPLPAAARGTGYASRAMSPVPSGLRKEIAVGSRESDQTSIPGVTEATRTKIVDSVRRCTVGLSAPEEAMRFVPRVELLNLFVQLYFSNGFHALLPLLHVPTFDPNAVPAYLVLAVASVGARYAHDKVHGAQMHAQALSETSRRMVQNLGDIDNQLLRTVPWQQSMLLVLYSGLVSGNKRDLERSEAFKSMAATFCKRQGWLHEVGIDEFEEGQRPLEERWTRWRDREEIKRLGFGAVGLDTTATLCWDMSSSSLFAEASHTSLPCHDQLWEAPTAEAWAGQFRGLALPAKALTTAAALHAMADRSQHSSPALLAIQRDGFAMQTVLGIVHALGWLRSHEEEVTGLFLPSARAWEGERASMAREGLSAAWEFYQDRVVLPPEIQRDMLGQVGPTTGLSFMLHLTALTSSLPLRLLQPLVRPHGTTPDSALSTLEDGLKAWAGAQGGETARRTAHHAGQLLGLSNHHLTPPPITGQPLEPFALFYGALALVVFCRYAAPVAKEGQLAQNELRGIALDRLVNPDDSKLGEWIKTGEGEVELEGVGQLVRSREGEEAGGVVGKLLIAVGERLVRGEVWKIGEGLGRSLLEMVKRE